jgi:hypothetical protein
VIIKQPHPTSGELAGYADQTLAPRPTAYVRHHLRCCATCRADIEAQRQVRTVLAARPQQSSVPSQLSDRLTSIAGPEAGTPLWLAPTRTGVLPSPRAVRRTRALSGSATMVVACAILLGLGYLVAPELPIVRDARQQASREYDLSTGTGAVAYAMTAVQAAPTSRLDTRPTVRSPHPLSSLEWTPVSSATARALLTDRDSLGYTGSQRVMLGSGTAFVQANVRVVHQPGEPLHLDVLDRRGEVVSSGLVVDPTPNEDTLLPFGAASFRTSEGGQIAGQTTTLLEARREDGSLLVRWWVADALGVVMWAEAFDPDQTLIRSAGFTSFTPTTLVDQPQPSDQLQLSLAPATVTSATSQMCGDGFSCAPELAGLPLLQISTDSPNRPSVVHAIYGRGDVRVSVMQQLGRWNDDDSVTYGVTQDRVLVSWQSDRVVYTVTTNGGHQLAARAVEQLPHAGPARTGVWQRATAGLKRLFGGR